ncbi:MAG TPA: VWA domain-containing protein [Elusimicrobiales bacterium]|nr:VWA domain-containing protein [Elusimicrobiales bacterium]
MELFRNPLVLLWGLFGIAGALLVFYLGYRRRQALLCSLGDPDLIAALTPPETAQRRRLKNLLLLGSLVLLFLAWAAPQWGMELLSSEMMTNHVVIAVDTSYSMQARDIKPSRLENAKRMLQTLIEQLNGYRIGIVAFSGKAYIQCPVTTDADALKYFVSQMQAGMLPEQGTDITDAVSLSASMLGKYPGRKALILLTDGENHSKGLEDALKTAESSGVSIFTVGIGSPEGDLIPMQEGGEYRKNREGKTVVSKLDEKTLMDMSAGTGGAYVRYTDPDSVTAALYKAVQELGSSKWKARARSIYKNRYQIPLFLGLLLLLIEFLIPEAGRARLRVPGQPTGKK